MRWLADSHKFNEWMNPVDYETEEYQKEQDALEQSAASRSRQGEGSEAIGSKRKFSPGGEGTTKRATARQRVDPGACPMPLKTLLLIFQPRFCFACSRCSCAV